MKNVIYYSSLIFLWLIIHFLLGTLVITIEGPLPSPLYILGISILIPELWVLSVGLTMLSRKVLAKRILCEEKSYSKIAPAILISLGSVLLGANILLGLIQKKNVEANITESDITEVNDEPMEMSGNNKEEALLAEAISGFKAGLNEEFEKTNMEVPLRTQEILILNKILISDSTYTFIYQLDIDKDDFLEGDLEGFIDDFGEDMKTEIFYSVLSLCRSIRVYSLDFFSAANIKFLYIFSDINDKHIATCGFELKDFTGN